MVFEPGHTGTSEKRRYGKVGGEGGTAFLRRIGAEPVCGFQLRYLYFLDPAARARLTVPVLPFAVIGERGAGMVRGAKVLREKQAMAGDQPAQRRGGTDPHAPRCTGRT